jgi:hypothetical protein
MTITIPGSEFFQLHPTNYTGDMKAAVTKPKYYFPMRPTTRDLSSEEPS